MIVGAILSFEVQVHVKGDRKVLGSLPLSPMLCSEMGGDGPLHTPKLNRLIPAHTDSTFPVGLGHAHTHTELFTCSV